MIYLPSKLQMFPNSLYLIYELEKSQLELLYYFIPQIAVIVTNIFTTRILCMLREYLYDTYYIV